MTTNINYVLGPEARRYIAKATGALAMPQSAALAALPSLPAKGDALRWDFISTSVIFVVESRLFRFGPNGDLDVDLFVDCDPQP